MKISNSTKEDISEIFRIYKIATDYMKERFSVFWPNFEKELIEREVLEKRQFKIVIDNKIACIWAITFSDEDIWQEKNKDAAIYIHRIAINSEFRGKNFIEIIVNWAKEYADSKNIHFIRLDTVGENHGLIKKYTENGFTFLGMTKIKNPKNLPEHYMLDDVSLFEINLKK